MLDSQKMKNDLLGLIDTIERLNAKQNRNCVT